MPQNVIILGITLFVVLLFVAVISLLVYHKIFRQQYDSDKFVSKKSFEDFARDVNQKLQNFSDKVDNILNCQASIERPLASSECLNKKKSKKDEKQERYVKKKNIKENGKLLEEPSVRSADVEYTYMKVSDGKLEKSDTNQTSYYRAWKQNGKYYYEFFCEETKVAKAINNRGVLIEPFCVKSLDSINPDEAENIETKSPGIIDITNNSIISKTIVKYI